MTMIQVERTRTSRSFTQRVPLTAILRRLLALMQPSYGVQWHSLNERLLRDIGKSPVDAEVAKLQARFGVSDAKYLPRTPLR